MNALELLDEWEESLFNHLSVWVRECIEDECIHISIAENLSKVCLHLAVTAETEVHKVDTQRSAHTRRICHTRT